MQLDLPRRTVPDRFSIKYSHGSYETLTPAVLEGPGCINHIWLCIGRKASCSRNAILRICFDDQPVPYVVAPVYLMIDWQQYPDQALSEPRRFCARWRHAAPSGNQAVYGPALLRP